MLGAAAPAASLPSVGALNASALHGASLVSATAAASGLVRLAHIDALNVDITGASTRRGAGASQPRSCVCSFVRSHTARVPLVVKLVADAAAGNDHRAADDGDATHIGSVAVLKLVTLTNDRAVVV